jgi:hypothetical protein
MCFSVIVACGTAFADATFLAGAAALLDGAAPLFTAAFAGVAVFLAAGADFFAGGITISSEKFSARQPARAAWIRTTTAKRLARTIQDRSDDHLFSSYRATAHGDCAGLAKALAFIPEGYFVISGTLMPFLCPSACDKAGTDERPISVA